MSMKRRIQLKVILLGNSGAGKSALMNLYVFKRYTNSYKATIGADFLIRDVTLDGKKVTVQVWDTAGTERFQSLGSVLYRGTDCCILVFDVTSEASFRALDGWRKEFLLQADPRDPDSFPFVVIGNKVDLSSSREVSTECAENWCEAHKLSYIETSVKEALNVEEAFRDCVRLSLKRLKSKDQPVAQSDHIQISPGDAKPQEPCACS
ncbi:uncharacterized protein [Scyliorhinus torazame]|uniref:uncharacterized protein n=1 Tax=Scyliorhinus torazame TaxID=75743 RepID=UPI003B5A4423